jgi:hypothetical protein
MDELIDLVVEKTSLNKKEAAVVVKLVLDYVKEKLPSPFGAQIDALLEEEGALGAAADLLSGLLGD